jgi:hypothetical protein
MSSRPLILCDRVSAEPSPYAKIITHWAHSPSSFLLPSISLTFHSLAWQVYSERPLSSGEPEAEHTKYEKYHSLNTVVTGFNEQGNDDSFSKGEKKSQKFL